MSPIVRVTVTIEDADGRATTMALAAIPGRPLLDEYDFSREPVIDHDAEARSGGMWRMMKPGPLMSIKLSAYGQVIEPPQPNG